MSARSFAGEVRALPQIDELSMRSDRVVSFDGAQVVASAAAAADVSAGYVTVATTTDIGTSGDGGAGAGGGGW